MRHLLHIALASQSLIVCAIANMLVLAALLNLCLGISAAVAAEPVLSKERVIMTTSYGDIQLAFYPEVLSKHQHVTCVTRCYIL